MKRVAILMAVIFSGCTEATPYGRCIGLNQEPDPALEYRISGWNIGVAVLTFELIAPPIIVALDQYKCPVGPAGAKK